jgi:hypothetical protein
VRAVRASRNHRTRSGTSRRLGRRSRSRGVVIGSARRASRSPARLGGRERRVRIGAPAASGYSRTAWTIGATSRPSAVRLEVVWVRAAPNGRNGFPFPV